VNRRLIERGQTTPRPDPCAEFVLVHAGAAPATADRPHVASAAFRTGGEPREGALDFYTDRLLRDRPSDVELVPVSQTLRHDRIIEESLVRFTRTVDLEWMLRGVAPRGHKVEYTLVGVITGVAIRPGDRPFVRVGCHRRTPAA
jgi:hypothetical protein